MSPELNLVLVFGAGFASVLSPCVLPVVPIVVAGTAQDHKLRPLLIVAGVSLSFILMGILSSLFGALIGQWMYKIEKGVGVLIALFGLLLMLNINVFKHVSVLSRLGQLGGGRLNGFLLGLLLGIIWIPCVGPLLSGVLALVATKGTVLTGVFFLGVYSLGFALPMLAAGYASQFFRNRIRTAGRYPGLVNFISGLLLLLLGGFIAIKGVLGFGSL